MSNIVNNVNAIKDIDFIYDFVTLDDIPNFKIKMKEILSKHFKGISQKEVNKAADCAFTEYANHLQDIRNKGQEFIKEAREKNMPIIVLAGRPYHLDPEINHGINKLICDLGAVVITEDSVSDMAQPVRTKVLNLFFIKLLLIQRIIL